MNVKWTSFGALSIVIWRVRMYLPSRLRYLLDLELHSDTTTKLKLESMRILGKNIGLDRNEVYAAVPSHMDPSGLTGRRRTTFFSVLVTIVIILFGSFLVLVITGNYPFNSPTTTYTPGSRYRSISPNDFINSA
jgi:hypothetical protein